CPTSLPTSAIAHTATATLLALSLPDALPISGPRWQPLCLGYPPASAGRTGPAGGAQCPLRAGYPDPRRPGLSGGRLRRHDHRPRSEEHTSELQSRENLVCRLLLEKKKETRKS